MMSSVDKLTLISGIDVPIPELRLSIHQPSIREIAFIGEKDFYAAAEVLIMNSEKFINNSGDSLEEKDNVALSEMSEFQLFMMMVNSNSLIKVKVIMLFSLLFPKFIIEFEERFILLVNSGNKETTMLDDDNFSVLQEVAKVILCLNSGALSEEFNPQGERAKEIAEKIKRGREKAARLKGETKKESSFLSKYISSLGIGTNSLNILNVLDLTLYQLFDQMERFGLNESYKISIKAKLAGSKEVEDVDWLKDIEK